MVRSDARLPRLVALGLTVVLTLAACGTNSGASQGASGGASAAPTPGGTIYILSQNEQWDQVDPQRVYTGEDLAFFSGTVMRSLTAYKFSADAKEGTSIVPDLATDLGTHNADATQWKFTLRDGVTWQDGKAITCDDVKYGVSRTFATDVINQGPTYAIAYLNIPTNATDGTSQYPGPYKATPAQQALYDKAVTCDGNTIAFNLNKSVPDFNFTVTLGFSPVPKAADTGETYGTKAPYVMASGPYMVQSYTTGNGGKMILVRNPNWKQSSDPYRHAYPDKWEVDFGIDPKVMDQRLMGSTGNDQFAIQYGQIQPENLATVFSDAQTPTAQFAGRAVSGFDPYTRYYWINVNKVKNVKIREAMAVALDRAAIRTNVGGAFAGDLADGATKPNIGQDYAPTGMWTDLFGQKIPDAGDPDYAKKLISESGEAAPAITYDFPDTPTQQKTAAIIIGSLGKAGIKVTANPIESGQYYSVVFDPQKAHQMGYGGWGADWPNASTVIPPLFTQKGGWDLSQLDDAAFNQKVEAAQVELDRAKQAADWQALNKEAMQNVYMIPYLFGLSQTLAGTKVAPIYRWPAYGSWPYGEMYVKQ
jgi:peptide/nickel transport system substrate-binding protein